jgi:ABC-type uncharacterized transport system permease subunit
MIYSIRISDIPKFIIGFVIAIALLGGLIALWKATGGMPEWVVYSLLAGIVVVSSVASHFIWKVACNAWKQNRASR